MPTTLATVFGVDASIVLLITTLLATISLTAIVLAILTFAWAPYLSNGFATEFGAQQPHSSADEQPSD